MTHRADSLRSLAERVLLVVFATVLVVAQAALAQATRGVPIEGSPPPGYTVPITSPEPPPPPEPSR
jgi:hypothetical protein